ncbi:hypothetical protein MUN76_05925 [Leucobacter rhizosphaerae]|uniref:Response regulatory domain-containing protein n=1 Tax=Leucobacter rhizosphaerae TaxID=2932245 RepID=A0ABY4FYX3_9MICO|nr:hypothetical protein [Leucobacter rhizosphaerae]UOQ61503.1 hypothetical protein MUN76_05925 [Leucobacter rhizosphaerae]
MTRKTWRVLIIDDNAQMAADAQREIIDGFEENPDIDVDVSVQTDFDQGFSIVRDGGSDVVVLDVRRDASNSMPADETVGHEVFHEIKEARFAPVIFWTALPENVQDEAMAPLVSVVGKEDIDQLPATIEAAIASRTVDTITTIEEHVTSVLTKHMWTELGPNWAEYTDGVDPATVAQVLISRLARILDDDREHAFTAHPSHRYIYPPASDMRSPGDVIREPGGDWWVVLTPACDFEQKKCEFVLLARAGQLETHKKYLGWTATKSSGKWAELRKDVLMATQGRFHYLPAFRNIPDLVIDLENVRSVTAETLEAMEAVASLVSPFSEALLVQHSHFRGRIGVPDLDAELIKQRLEAVPPVSA